jgi:peptidoglycan/LPS O-acetylase OafA/YrhL
MVKRLLLLNGLAAIGAVIHHAVSWDLTAMFWWADRYRLVSIPDLSQLWSLRYIFLRVLDQFAFPAVFAFLIVSGYFVTIAAGGRENTIPWKLVLQRVKNLIFPYLLWSFVIVSFNWVQGNTYSARQLLRLLLTGGASVPYYYVPLLIQLYVLAPLLVSLARRKPGLLLAFVIALHIPVTYAHYATIYKLTLPGFERIFAILRDWHLLGYLLWFVLGMLLGLHPERIKQVLRRLRFPLLACLMVVFIASIAEWELIRQISGREWLAVQVTIGGKVFALLLLLSFFAFDKLRVPFSAQVSQIGAKSYGIYLIHVLILELAARGIYHVAPRLLAYQLPYVLLLCAAGIGVPLLMMAVVNQIQPLRRFYGYIFG